MVVPEVEELAVGAPHEVALENALRKARAVSEGKVLAEMPDADAAIVLAADTVVELDGVLYGKPADEGAARAALRSLSGMTHTVVGAVVLLRAGEEARSATAATQVSFRSLADAEIDWYLQSGEWRGRAGGYAIQGRGGALVKRIDGDYENVVGLALQALLGIWPQLLQMSPPRALG